LVICDSLYNIFSDNLPTFLLHTYTTDRIFSATWLWVVLQYLLYTK
jgi:hypothetical protein